VVDGEVDAGREGNSRGDEEDVGDKENEIVCESNVVEIELRCAVSREDGIGIEDVNSGTGDWNDPLIRSSLNWRLSNQHYDFKKLTNEKVAENAINEEFGELTEENCR
jgi:hypothetical protein